MRTVSNGQVSALSGPTGSDAANDAASQRCSPVGWSTAKSACVAHSEIRLKTNGRWLLVVCAGKWRTLQTTTMLALSLKQLDEDSLARLWPIMKQTWAPNILGCVNQRVSGSVPISLNGGQIRRASHDQTNVCHLIMTIYFRETARTADLSVRNPQGLDDGERSVALGSQRKKNAPEALDGFSSISCAENTHP